jgi:hypothetical protein
MPPNENALGCIDGDGPTIDHEPDPDGEQKLGKARGEQQGERVELKD